MTGRTIKQYFISALELEHPDNKESATKNDKIIAAIRRREREKINSIVLDRIDFDSKELGYNISAILLC